MNNTAFGHFYRLLRKHPCSGNTRRGCFSDTKACTAAKKYSSAKLAELVGNLANVGYGVVSGGAAVVDALEKIMAGFEW